MSTKRATDPSIVQFWFSTCNQKPHAAPMLHQKNKANVGKTIGKFRKRAEDVIVYVDANASESPTKVDEPFQKSRTRKEHLYKISKAQQKTASVKKDVVHSRSINDRLSPNRGKS